jgi:hypothetical protein
MKIVADCTHLQVWINVDRGGLNFIRVHPSSSVVKIRPDDYHGLATHAPFNPSNHGFRRWFYPPDPRDPR